MINNTTWPDAIMSMSFMALIGYLAFIARNFELRRQDLKKMKVIAYIKDINGEIDWKPIQDRVYDALIENSNTDIVVCVREEI